MDLFWIPLTIFAALMQAVRTAGQKTLNQTMSTMGTTYVRSLFGLPVMAVYLLALLYVSGSGWPQFTPTYFMYTALGASAQVLGTALLITMFQLQNFAVGTMLTKTDILITAVIGTLFFSENISLGGWLALMVVMAGFSFMLMGEQFPIAKGSAAEPNKKGTLTQAAQIAFSCALAFTFSYLFLREAVLELGSDSTVMRGAWTVVIATLMQVAVLGIWLKQKDPEVFGKIRSHMKAGSFIGITSALGSIGWYTAFAMQNASYVRAVGQIEAVFTLLISWAYFREKITALEFAGILVTLAGVLMFRLI